MPRARRARCGAAASLALVVALASPARAERPLLAGEASYGTPDGDVRVHYATSGPDAAPTLDADRDGVPDFVVEVAETAEAGLAHFMALGFLRPLDDGALGGDGRVDIYLRDLANADGSASIDSCVGDRCVGYTVVDNDFAEFSYPSITEGIRSVVPHEVFHLVQNAYSIAQTSTWTEASAVWSVENLYGAGNSDFERFLPAFLPKMLRPFERPFGGIGDFYPYGAALWPYFLEHRYGVDTVVDAWAASETAPFLEAVDQALQPRGATTDAAWIEFSRWNVFTGARAAGGPYPDAAAWPQVTLEAAIPGTGKVFVEGLSARYAPITVAQRAQLRVSPAGTVRVAAWAVRDGGHLDDGVELTGQTAELAGTLEPGSYTLVVTGLSRNTITTAVDIALEDPSDAGGCASTRGSSPALLLVVAGLWLRRRSRMTRSVL